MFKISEKFFKNLQKLEDYWIIRHDEEEIILGHYIVVKVHKEEALIFSTYTSNIDTRFPIFFLLTTLDKPMRLKGEFEKRKLPIIQLDKDLMKADAQEINKVLSDFIAEIF